MSRHGKLAPGKTRVTIVMPEAMKAELQALAKKENRSFGNLIETRLQVIVQEEQAAYVVKPAKKKPVTAVVHLAEGAAKPAEPRKKKA